MSFPVDVARLILREYIRECINALCARFESLGRLYPRHGSLLSMAAAMLGWFGDGGYPRDQIEALEVGRALLAEAEEQAPGLSLQLNFNPLRRLRLRCTFRR